MLMQREDGSETTQQRLAQGTSWMADFEVSAGLTYYEHHEITLRPGGV